MDAERFRRALTEDETLRALLESGTAPEPLLDLTQRVYADALDLIASRREALALERSIELAELALAEVAEKRRRLRVIAPDIACKRGCSSCCVLRVEASPLEAARLLALVAELNLAEQVHALAAEVGQLSRAARLARQRACVFLGSDGGCRAHAVRPMACRAANSRSSDACREAVNNADALARIPVDSTPFSLMRAAAVGLSVACADAGLPSAPEELHTAVSRALRVAR